MQEFQPIRFAVTLQRRDVAIHFLYASRWRLGQICFVLLWMTGAWAFIPGLSFSWTALFYCLAGAFAFAAFAVWRTVRRQRPSTTWYEVLEEGLHSSRSAAEKSWAWPSFVRMRETPRLFLLDTGISIIPLPAFTMTAEEKQQVRALLSRTICAADSGHHSRSLRTEIRPPAFGVIVPTGGQEGPSPRPAEEQPSYTYACTVSTDTMAASANLYASEEKTRSRIIAITAFGLCYLVFNQHPWGSTLGRLLATYAGIFLLPLFLVQTFTALLAKRNYAACPVLQGVWDTELSPSACYVRTPLSQSRITWTELGDAEETEHAFLFTNESGLTFIQKNTLGEKGVDALRSILGMKEQHLSPRKEN